MNSSHLESHVEVVFMKKGIYCDMCTIDGYCPKPLEAVSGYLSKKWMISTIVTIGNFKKIRFQQLQRRMKITPKMLSSRLQELMKEKIVSRHVFKTIPLQIEYALTKRGKQLLRALLPLMDWADQQK